jgi:hypothetical protein
VKGENPLRRPPATRKGTRSAPTPRRHRRAQSPARGGDGGSGSSRGWALTPARGVERRLRLPGAVSLAKIVATLWLHHLPAEIGTRNRSQAAKGGHDG